MAATSAATAMRTSYQPACVPSQPRHGGVARRPGWRRTGRAPSWPAGWPWQGWRPACPGRRARWCRRRWHSARATARHRPPRCRRAPARCARPPRRCSGWPPAPCRSARAAAGHRTAATSSTGGFAAVARIAGAMDGRARRRVGATAPLPAGAVPASLRRIIGVASAAASPPAARRPNTRRAAPSRRAGRPASTTAAQPSEGGARHAFTPLGASPRRRAARHRSWPARTSPAARTKGPARRGCR